MAASAPNTQKNAETIPQIAMYISESFMSQPPSAAWPPLPPAHGGLPPVVAAPPPPPPTSPPRQASALQSAPKRPPPPSTPTSNAGRPARPAAATYSAITPQTPSVLFAMTQPPPIVPPSFDASVPPPPIPTHFQTTNAQLKRKIEVNGNAGKSKRKPEGPELTESNCENCVQRELRIDGYKQQMEALHNEEEAQILLYKKKLQEYEIGRDLLKTIVGPELFSVFDKLIEGAQTPQLDNSASFTADSSTVSKQTLLQLFQVLLGGGARILVDPVPSTSHVDETLHSLTSLTRRHSASSFSNQGSDLMKFVMDTLRNNTASDRTPSEERPNEVLNRTNGHKEATSVSEPARYEYPAAGTAGGIASYPVAGPSGYSAPYPMHHPAVPPPPSRPPPSRPPHYYPQPPAATYNGNVGAPQEMQPPTTSAVLRPNHANAQNYYMARYPQPPYFPPYQ